MVAITVSNVYLCILKGFFVIRLQSNATGNASDLPEIKDPDPLMNCDLMDGRDAFLTMSRDKHYEFSSLRRSKYSTAGMLHELHNQARDSFTYVCNACKANVETRYHCTTCDVSSHFCCVIFVVIIILICRFTIVKSEQLFGTIITVDILIIYYHLENKDFQTRFKLEPGQHGK